MMMLIACLMGGFAVNANAQGKVVSVNKKAAAVQVKPQQQNTTTQLGVDNGAHYTTVGEKLGAYVSNVKMYIAAKNDGGEAGAASYKIEADKLEKELKKAQAEMSKKQLTQFEQTKEQYSIAKSSR